MPERDPDSRWIARERREELADTLSSCPDEVFRHCPAIFAESVMTDIRAIAGGRKAKPQDSFDLMHIVPALAYCDAFISNDGLLRKQAKEASGRTGRSVVILHYELLERHLPEWQQIKMRLDGMAELLLAT